jgi:DNA polymerase-1
LTPTKFWCIVCKDINTGESYIFDRPYEDNYSAFKAFAEKVTLWIGHNFLGYDLYNLLRLVPGLAISPDACIDTLVVSRLIDFARPGGHSLEQYGLEFGAPKVAQEQWDTYDPNMVTRCIQDTEINLKVYLKYSKYILSSQWSSSLAIEHLIAWDCTNELTHNGFYFNLEGAKELLQEIEGELRNLDNQLLTAFPPKPKFIREVTPRATKFGTIAKNSIPKVLGNDLTAFTPDAPFSLFEFEEFNPGSTKQRVERLWEAGWKPVNKTKGHKDFLRTISRRKLTEDEKAKKEHYDFYGWMTDEDNLATLPPEAPDAAKKLVRRLILSSRVSRLTEWINACGADSRIHGQFFHIGAWTHRMSHSAPNMGNIPKFDARQPEKTPYSDRMRALWGARPGRYLVGVDAESIQLRIFAHIVGDEDLIKSILFGDKKDGTDPHSRHWKMWEDVGCKSRDDSKTALYATFLGATAPRIAECFGTTRENGERAIAKLLDFYPGLGYIKGTVIPQDALRGYFEGFDGRLVKIRGEDQGRREHYTLGGYLQNGEACIMKHARPIWRDLLSDAKIPYWWVNLVHDEYQFETVRDLDVATKLAEIVAESIKLAGEKFKLKIPMAGSILNAHGKLAIGDNWMDTH